MSGIPEEGIYGNVASQSSNVSQGGRRRTRSEFEGDTDYSSTTRRRLEGMYRPQWTMSSSVEDILLEGTTNRTDMKLNDFLRSNLGGRVAVDEDYNVTMQAFVLRPTMFINDSEILGIITTLPSYRELEAINKLHDEGVFSLGQWKVFKSKNTVAPLAKGKLNAAFTEVLRKEKARREEEEKARRDQQQINLNLTLSIKDAIFQGRARFYKKKMNDFLTLELDGRGVADTNRRVLLKEFFKEPARYIHDAGVLNEIKKTDAYLRAERAVREEMDMEKDIKDLEYNHLSTLLGWSLATAEIKASVHDITKRFLDAALEEAKKPTTTIAPIEMEGFYESVYNASWHHVVEVPGGEGTGMEVREGKPPQSWTYKAVSRTLEKDDGVEQSGAPRLRLMVLTSDDEWPYTWKNDGRNISDCYVDCEVERVWQIVKGNLTGLFSAYEGTKYIPKRHVLIGTPGIGKSMNAGSYLLYQLLHYDAEELPMVAYVIADRKFLFDKTAKTVKKHGEASSIVDILDEFSGRGVKGYIIYDVAKPGHEPPAGLPCKGWGMIVVTSPNEGNFKEWEKQKGSVRIVMNCPAKEDVKAMCVCMNRNEPTVQAGYWRKVEGRMDKVGPLLRYVFDQATYKDRIDSCRSTINKMVLQDTQYYSVLGTDKMCEGNHVSHKLVKVVRVRGKEDAELPYNALISSHLAELTLCKLAELMVPNDFNLLVLAIKDDLLSKALEDHSLLAFLSAAFVNAIIPKLKELKVKRNAPPHLCALRVHPHERPFKPLLLPLLEDFEKKINIECRVLYKPEAENFPLVDGFFFLESQPKTLVGLQMTTASEHHTITSTVNLFKERMESYFNDWEELSRELSWEIIYIQHADSTPMNGWQKCNYVNRRNKTDAEKEIVAFWDEKVHQYQVSVSSRDFKGKEALPIVEEQRQQETE